MGIWIEHIKVDDGLDFVDGREDKKKLRKLMEASRQQLSREHRQFASELICQLTMDVIVNHVRSIAHQPTIVAYMPFRSEVDITSLIRQSWKANFKLCVPKVNKSLQSMEAYEIHSFLELETGAWGILEPNAKIARLVSLSSIDFMIIPGLSYDRQGGRLGYGSGFYDRFLSRFDVRGLTPPLKLGVCFDAQLQDKLPMEPHDHTVDHIITEKAVYDNHH
jgi:5-formyltetrahydrofolate cyclo-ligase